MGAGRRGAGCRGEEAVVLEEKLGKVAVALDMNLVLALPSPCQGK